MLAARKANCAVSSGRITRTAHSVNQSIWKTFVNKPKTRTSADSGPVIGQSAEVLISYRSSVGDPSSGVMFHSGGGDPET
jgi:hypothetical protein